MNNHGQFQSLSYLERKPKNSLMKLNSNENRKDSMNDISQPAQLAQSLKNSCFLPPLNGQNSQKEEKKSRLSNRTSRAVQRIKSKTGFLSAATSSWDSVEKFQQEMAFKIWNELISYDNNFLENNAERFLQSSPEEQKVLVKQLTDNSQILQQLKKKAIIDHIQLFCKDFMSSKNLSASQGSLSSSQQNVSPRALLGLESLSEMNLNQLGSALRENHQTKDSESSNNHNDTQNHQHLIFDLTPSSIENNSRRQTQTLPNNGGSHQKPKEQQQSPSPLKSPSQNQQQHINNLRNLIESPSSATRQTTEDRKRQSKKRNSKSLIFPQRFNDLIEGGEEEKFTFIDDYIQPSEKDNNTSNARTDRDSIATKVTTESLKNEISKVKNQEEYKLALCKEESVCLREAISENGLRQVVVGAVSTGITGAIVFAIAPVSVCFLGLQAALIAVHDIGTTIYEYNKGQIDKKTFIKKLGMKLMKGIMNAGLSLAIAGALILILGNPFGLMISPILAVLSGMLITGANAAMDQKIEEHFAKKKQSNYTAKTTWKMYKNAMKILEIKNLQCAQNELDRIKRIKLRQYHPDKIYGSELDKKKGATQFMKIVVAYETAVKCRDILLKQEE